MAKGSSCVLCYIIVKFTILKGAPAVEGEEENYAAASVPAVLMMIFQYTDNSGKHTGVRLHMM